MEIEDSLEVEDGTEGEDAMEVQVVGSCKTLYTVYR
jgi:hypothetical protein